MTKKILIVGIGACMTSISKVLASEGIDKNDVIIVTPENIDEHRDVIQEQNPFKSEPIMLTAPPRMDDEYMPTRAEIESHPFSKFMGKGRKGKRW